MRRELPVADSNQIAYPQDYFLSNRFAYAIGPTLFITTVSSVVNYKLVGIQWLDDLTGAETPDIFLTYYTDWFKYATLAALNIYLKDSERFPIDASTMENLWQSVKAHDGMIANMGESVDLE